jgi:hypothetical protein
MKRNNGHRKSFDNPVLAVAAHDHPPSSVVSSAGDSTSTSNSSNKRPKVKHAPQEQDADASAAEQPKYGTRQYWDARYKSHTIPSPSKSSSIHKNNGNEDEDHDDVEDVVFVDGIALTKDATNAGHEWYFTYSELRPLILPLILGKEDDYEGDEDDEDDDDNDVESWVEETDEEEKVDDDDETLHTTDNRAGINERIDTNLPCNLQDDGEAAVNDDDDDQELDDDDVPSIIIPTKPKRILEIGCGDRPLGSSLISDLCTIAAKAGIDVMLLVNEITCIDYSDVVVNALKNNDRQRVEDEKVGLVSVEEKVDSLPITTTTDNNNNAATTIISTPIPTYLTMDARSLSFLSNTYDLILEKGTLDAMLSSNDTDGINNCITIVKEMARVVSCNDGAILIVSHLNANDDAKGMDWLHDVVVGGLKEEFVERHSHQKKDHYGNDMNDVEYVWSIEVHGGEAQYLDTNGNVMDDDRPTNNDTNEEEEGVDHVVYGPAVYIIKKKSIRASMARELYGKKKKKTNGRKEDGEEVDNECDEAEDEMPPVKLSFMTY